MAKRSGASSRDRKPSKPAKRARDRSGAQRTVSARVGERAPRALVRPTPDAADAPASKRSLARWVARGDELLALLAKHGVGDHEVRADLKDGRFVWMAPDGSVSAE